MAPNPKAIDLQPQSDDFVPKRPYHRHHNVNWKQQSHFASIDHDAEGLHQQLTRAISLILAAVGFEAATPDALASFVFHVESFMNHFLGYTRASMSSSRRTRPLPHDFEYALISHRYTFQSLLPHLNPPVSTEDSYLQLVAETVTADENVQLMGGFHATLNDHAEPKLAYAPRMLPILPSRHTYRATLSFLPRERDPKKIRELATEEARMGEEALRRLVQKTGQQKGKELERTLTHRQKQRKLWQDTMEAMAGEIKGDNDMLDDTTIKMDLTSIPVNADRANWRRSLGRSEQEVV